MIKAIAVIMDGVVVNVAEWTGDQEWWDLMVGSGYVLVDVTDFDPMPSLDWFYDANTNTFSNGSTP